MKINTIVEDCPDTLMEVINALNNLKEDRFIEGVLNRRHSIREIVDMVDTLGIYQLQVNREGRRLAEFSNVFIGHYTTPNNKCYDKAHSLLGQIHTTLEALLLVLKKTAPIMRQKPTMSLEAPSAFSTSPLLRKEYQLDAFGLESFPEAVQHLYVAVDTLFSTCAVALSFCHDMMEREAATREDIVQLRQIFDETCEELKTSMNATIDFASVQQIPANVEETYNKLKVLEEDEERMKQGYHNTPPKELQLYLWAKQWHEARNEGLTDEEISYWPDDHQKALRVREGLALLPTVRGAEGQNGSFNSCVLVEFIKWCGIDEEKNEKRFYEEYVYPKLLAQGKLKPLKWKILSSQRKSLKETGSTDESLAAAFEKRLPQPSADNERSINAHVRPMQHVS